MKDVFTIWIITAVSICLGAALAVLLRGAL